MPATGDHYTAISFLSTDPRLLAVANVATLLGGLAIALAASRWAYRFIRTTLRVSLKVALRRTKRRFIVKWMTAAYDVHLFIAYLWINTVLLALGMTGLLSAVTMSPALIKAEGKDFQHYYALFSIVTFTPYIVYGMLDTLMGVFLVRDRAGLRARTERRIQFREIYNRAPK